MDIEAREIRCPKSNEHIHKKILVILGQDYISVYCREHGWMKIELRRAGQNIHFDNVSAKISAHGKGANFILSPIPGVAVGKIESKRDRRVKHTQV